MTRYAKAIAIHVTAPSSCAVDRSEHMNTSRHFVVLGAGPMGLMATMELLKAGHEVDLYERDDRIGGMSASFDFGRLQIERYYHYSCKTDYAFFRLLDELGLGHTLRWVDTHMGYFYGGKLQDWGNPVALLKFRGLGLVGKFRYGHACAAREIRQGLASVRQAVGQAMGTQMGRRPHV